MLFRHRTRFAPRALNGVIHPRHLGIRDRIRQLFKRIRQLRMCGQNFLADDIAAAVGWEKTAVVLKNDGIRCGELSVRRENRHNVDLTAFERPIFKPDIEIHRPRKAEPIGAAKSRISVLAFEEIVLRPKGQCRRSIY